MKPTFLNTSRRTDRWIITVACVIALCSIESRAEIRWIQTEQALSAEVTDSKASATFAYVNEGKTRVTFEKISASCGCTTVTAAAKVIEPGQSGEIHVSMSLGSKVGLVSGNVVVKADDGSITRLALIVTVPDILTFNPKIVVWKQGQEEQVLKVHVATEQPVEIVKVQGPIGVVLDVNVVKPGREYEVRIRAPEGAKARTGTLRLVTNVKAGDTMKIIEVPQTTE